MPACRNVSNDFALNNHIFLCPLTKKRVCLFSSYPMEACVGTWISNRGGRAHQNSLLPVWRATPRTNRKASCSTWYLKFLFKHTSLLVRVTCLFRAERTNKYIETWRQSTCGSVIAATLTWFIGHNPPDRLENTFFFLCLKLKCIENSLTLMSQHTFLQWHFSIVKLSSKRKTKTRGRGPGPIWQSFYWL